MWKRILVPVDATPGSEAVLAQVERFAAPDTHIALLHVVPALASAQAADLRRQSGVLSAVQDRLDRLAARFKGWASTVVDCGDPARRIVAIARAMDADLIAMTTHDRTGLSRLMLGSIAAGVVRRTRIPVMLVKPDLHVPARPLSRILATYENTPAGRHLLRAVGSRAAAFGCEIILLTSDRGAVTRELETVRAATWTLAASLAPSEIARRAAWFDVDIIAACSGTAERVLHRADRPVLVLPARTAAMERTA